MLTSTQIYSVPVQILDKLKQLFNILQEGRNKYEKVAAAIENKELQRTVVGLAMESNQYAVELSSQIQCLGGDIKEWIERSKPKISFVRNEQYSLKDETAILEMCEVNEKKMINTYRDILKEPFLVNGLRNMIEYQLNGLMGALLQLKLLHTSLHK